MKEMPDRGTVIGTHSSGVPSIVHEALRSPGQPLDEGTRAYMEPRFGHDFSKVRIHADSKAAESAQSINALAYAAGNDLVFGGGRYAPATANGQRLIGHELAHIVQNRSESEPHRVRRWPFGVLEERAIRQGQEEEKPKKVPSFNITTDGCDQSPYVKETVEKAAKDAYEKVLNSDCVKSESLKDEILSEFDGLNIDCEQSGGKCGKAYLYFTQTVNIYPDALDYSKCGPLESTILHEVVHLTEWLPGEGDRAAACEKSCFGYGSGDASKCK